MSNHSKKVATGKSNHKRPAVVVAYEFERPVRRDLASTLRMFGFWRGFSSVFDVPSPTSSQITLFLHRSSWDALRADTDAIGADLWRVVDDAGSNRADGDRADSDGADGELSSAESSTR